jgi:hypothetical protein
MYVRTHRSLKDMYSRIKFEVATFWVLTAVLQNTLIFGDVTPCRSKSSCRSFEGTQRSCNFQIWNASCLQLRKFQISKKCFSSKKFLCTLFRCLPLWHTSIWPCCILVIFRYSIHALHLSICQFIVMHYTFQTDILCCHFQLSSFRCIVWSFNASYSASNWSIRAL